MPKSESITAKEIWEYATRNLTLGTRLKRMTYSVNAVLVAATERIFNNTTIALKKAFQVEYSGSCYYGFYAKVENGSETLTVAIAVNNTVVATLNLTNTDYQLSAAVIYVNAGDFVNIYANVSTGTYQGYIKDAALYYDVIDDDGAVITD